jgi:hypothetical protein
MGYEFNITDSSFRIEQQHYPDLIDHLIKFHTAAKAQNVLFKWCEHDKCLAALNEGDLLQFLHEWNYEAKIDITTGDIVDIHTQAEKLGDEEKLWEQIAPWVMDGSYIQCHGEDSSQWRWVWREGAYYFVEATLHFDDPIDCGYRIINANMMDDELRAAREAVGYREDRPVESDKHINPPMDTQYALNALRTKGTT